ncbi:diguanylate cyclase (GGDEF)-like protein [Paenibacillus castaneae]|uniref:putative bifunctional diguanylate cyclase/phosphodiesterase n=1 Tax=Paenibacillus castaneae TaxID=474957 RepID=UPI000C9B5553|nr:bifunctional diguanylate cyclase/phosphodiesterase [Paenibacillus castaneae]NIK78144.1 diguanylate cyclase (GGDEF)-like protein [Paenibacillus castaneae]
MDALTGLPGRKEAFAQLEVAVNVVRAAGKRLVVAMVDLDRFYRVNETKGTDFGNHMLCIMSKRLAAARTIASAVCRIGGNRFLVAMPVEHDENNGFPAVEAIKNAIERPIDVDGNEFYFTTSIGATLYPQDGRTSEQLICRAESALHQSKEQGGNRALFYNMEDTRQLNRRLSIEAALRPAFYLRQFHVCYQPVFHVKDGKLRGFEALIRWNHSELGEVPPAEFIPIAEHNGLIIPIGEWVLREACKMLAGMEKCGLSSLVVSINLSPLQLQDPSFYRTVLHVLEEYELQPSALELEITEHIAIYNSAAAIAALSSLRAAGVRIVIDDFGTGYSSLANLRQLPIQCLKIDKSFIRKIELQSAERIIVEDIIKLVHRLGLEVTAEGVENEEQYALLREWGCDFAQGFLFGKPMPQEVIDQSIVDQYEHA